jgi:hypothetical protein
MRRLLSFLILLGAASWAQTPSALETDPKGWTDIMPDASFKGWTRLPFMTTTAMDAVSQWKVDTANKVLICEGDRGHEWLRYDKELADIIFHAEYRFTKIEGGKSYNSGVMVRNNTDGSIWHQAQAGDASGGFLMGSTLVKGAVQRVNMRSKMPAVNPVKPAGEWNVYEMRAEGPKIALWVNGVVTPELTDLEVLKGYPGLEAEGYRVEFRNLKLKVLR